jgi:oligoribonuclease NrnB/cAMP/cGMP phosphodiesterase (DHH superfamily)
VLDKPQVAKEFVQEMEQLNCNMVWIDHHPSNIEDFKDKLGKNIFYFNPLLNGESNEPTSYLCYNAIKKKEDEWIALLGCLADWFIPPFAKEFSQENSDFFPYTEDPAKAFFTTPIGTMVRVLDFALKDRTTNIVRTLKILLDIKNYKDLTEENNKTIPVFARFKQINKKYQKILEKGKKMKTGKLLFFRYGGALSLSSELANELFYLNQDKVVVVAYTKGNKANVSVRGLINVRDLACNALKGMESTCGGHKNACGATVAVENLGRFRGNLLRMLDTGNYT